MRRALTFGFILMLWGLSVTTATLQEDDSEDSSCIFLPFLDRSELRVVGSREAGGLPIRERVGFDEPVIGLIPINTILSNYEYIGCEDGRNWFWTNYSTSDDEPMDGVAVVDDGVNVWLEANTLCPDSANYLEFISAEESFTNIDQAYFWNDELYIGVGDRYVHPILLNHYHVQTPEGILTPVEYPFADIVTRELTDSLGITDRVFGENSTSGYSIHVSPDGERILYFTTGRQVESPCAEVCGYVDAYVANADGSDPQFLAEVPTILGLNRIYWGTDGRLYLTHTPEVGPVTFTVGICIDDDCEIEGGVDQIAEAYGVTIAGGAIPTTSPSGRYLALNPLYPTYLPDETEPQFIGPVIIDLETGDSIQLPYAGETGFPIIWGRENNIYVAIGDYIPEGTYDFEVDPPMLLWIRLDFETSTYDIQMDMLELSDYEPTMISWNVDWAIRYGSRTAYRADGYLHCIVGVESLG